jgi:sulfur-oxidizing protein SoxY
MAGSILHACQGTTFEPVEAPMKPNLFRKLRRSVATLFLAAAAGSAFVCAGPVAAQQSMAGSEKIWASLKGDVLGDRPILLDTGLIRIEAPKRAQDAALVPVDIYIDPAKAAGVKKVTMVIDVNPAPVAATFQLGKDAGVTHLATRVRVNDYSWLRVIAETESGELHMSQTFVKASGGCSAPAVKNSKEALASMGQMKLRQFVAPAEETMTKAQELQLMIRHPNNSGLQRDPLTQYFIPAHFVQNLSISQGDRLILSMEGGISISEDPNFRFDFAVHGNDDIRVEAIDTDGKVFTDKWPLDPTGL